MENRQIRLGINVSPTTRITLPISDSKLFMHLLYIT